MTFPNKTSSTIQLNSPECRTHCNPVFCITEQLNTLLDINSNLEVPGPGMRHQWLYLRHTLYLCLMQKGDKWQNKKKEKTDDKETMEEGREKHRSNRQNIRKENKEEKQRSKAVSNHERSKKWNGTNTGNEIGHEVLGKTYEA